ncbi:MAG: M20 family peptidase [Gemmatimonadaceae bacterium]|nr:M20 family peptidase [Gemmatimonadaceae bacterium]
MRRALLAVLALIVAVVGTALFRASSLKPAPALTAGTIAIPALPSADSSAAHLSAAVRFQTVTISETAPPPAAALDSMRGWMERTYPLAHKAMSREQIDGYSLLYKLTGKDAALAPIVLMGHMDVVPVEAGTETNWKHPPFSGAVADGEVWGRGSLDDKVNVVGLMEAIEAMLAGGFQPDRTIYIAFGHNEEVLGSGAKAIADTLRARGVRPALVLDEGGAILSEGLGLKRPAALVGVGEKGFMSVQLEVKSAGGHSSSPPPQTATGILARAVANVQERPLPRRLTPPVRSMIAAMAPEMGGAAKVVLGNLWLTKPLVLAQFGKKPETDAMLRTTTAPTMLQGSAKENALAARATAVINYRLLPGDSREDILAHVRRAVDDPRVNVSAYSTGAEPSTLSRPEGPAWAALSRAVGAVDTNTVMIPWLTTGGTDARYYSGMSDAVYRFSALVTSPAAMTLAHGMNERVSVAGFAGVVRFYARIIAEGGARW